MKTWSPSSLCSPQEQPPSPRESDTRDEKLTGSLGIHPGLAPVRCRAELAPRVPSRQWPLGTELLSHLWRVIHPACWVDRSLWRLIARFIHCSSSEPPRGACCVPGPPAPPQGPVAQKRVLRRRPWVSLCRCTEKQGAPRVPRPRLSHCQWVQVLLEDKGAPGHPLCQADPSPMGPGVQQGAASGLT